MINNSRLLCLPSLCSSSMYCKREREAYLDMQDLLNGALHPRQKELCITFSLLNKHFNNSWFETTLSGYLEEEIDFFLNFLN